MKTIDHDPNEHRKLPDYGYGAFWRKEAGRELLPSDLLAKLIPILVITIGIFGWRSGWWF